jgi:site-specific DNA-methyltransferase (adenine-specific)
VTIDTGAPQTDLVPATTEPARPRPYGGEGLHGRLAGKSYTLPPNLTIDEWLADGEILQAIEESVGFWIGDWLAAGKRAFGEARYSQALKATGYAYKTLRNALSVALKFPLDERREGVPFTAYAEVAALPRPEAHKLIEDGFNEQGEFTISTRDLRDQVKLRQSELRYAEMASLPIPERELPNATVLQGDALNLALDDASVDLIVTSPPYALDKEYTGGDVSVTSWRSFLLDAMREAFRVLKPHGRIALNVPLDTTLGGFRPTYAQAVACLQRAGFEYRTTVLWIDDQLGKSTARGSIDSAASPHIIAPAECIILASKGDWAREEPYDRPSDLGHDGWLEWTNGIWRFPGESNAWEGHPAPFPLELPKRLVYLLSFPGDVVLDQFCGSGTTVVAARRAGRQVIAVDASPLYVASTLRRLAQMVD